ncbi:MAG: redoxin domain-containing protein [bacterium]|nr:MAG: redoxin domain-containing protein [bacterium]
MKFTIRAVFVHLALLALILATPAVGQPERGIEVGQSIPPRELRTMEREKVMVPAPEGITAVIFWATWSPRSAPALELWKKLGDEYAEHGVQVLSVNADHQQMSDEDIAKVQDYIAQNNVTLPVIMDTDLGLFNEIGVIVLPTTLFFTPDGTLDFKYPGLPTSADLDLKEKLEVRLGIAPEPTEEEKETRGQLAYQPKNNALLYYNLGRQLHQKGLGDKARERYVIALQKDPDYADPLRGLEEIFFAGGRSPEAETGLEALLEESGLGALVEKISAPGEAQEQPEPGPEEAGQDAEQAGTAEKALSPMERMRLLMEKGNK